jgi:hypothetical protein
MDNILWSFPGVGHDKAHPRVEFVTVPLDLGHHPAILTPTGSAI